jgi:hypothetical protein
MIQKKIGANTEIGGENFGQDSFEKKIIDELEFSILSFYGLLKLTCSNLMVAISLFN